MTIWSRVRSTVLKEIYNTTRFIIEHPHYAGILFSGIIHKIISMDVCLKKSEVKKET